MPFLTANLLSRSYKFIFEFLLFLNFSFVIRISIFLLEYIFFLLEYSFFLLEYFPFSNWTLYSFLNFSLFITLKWNPLENNKTFYKSKYFEFWLELFPLLILNWPNTSEAFRAFGAILNYVFKQKPCKSQMGTMSVPRANCC